MERSPWQQQYGNIAQIVAAVAAITTCGAAIYGVSKLSPVVQLHHARETVSRLDNEARTLATKIESKTQELERLSVSTRDGRRALWNALCYGITQQIAWQLLDIQRAVWADSTTKSLTLRHIVHSAIGRATIGPHKVELPSDLQQHIEAFHSSFVTAPRSEPPMDEPLFAYAPPNADAAQTAAELTRFERRFEASSHILPSYGRGCEAAFPSEQP
jgi:hypothetical protein